MSTYTEEGYTGDSRMSDTRIIVDHWKLDYDGLMDVKELFKLINNWSQERHIQKKEDKCHEQNLPEGKFIEYEISHWKKISDYTRYIYKIRILFQRLKKVEVRKEKKKVKMDQGHILIYFDGFIEHDYEHRWDERPMFLFFRTLMDKFIYRAYTERFEHRLVHEMHG
ncbi:hypothetical protein KY358_03370, partial [Candidatus Woesearchaeota archaeon]|nr:hypothetical protein [Candidatus Woesearchaeota archaeon]